jgi:hypothetical protein
MDNIKAGLCHGILTFAISFFAIMSLNYAGTLDAANTQVAFGITPADIQNIFTTLSPKDLSLALALLIFIGPLIEELLCRVLPLCLAIKLSGKPPVIWAVVVSTSIVFAMEHGVNMLRLAIQGTMGFIFAIVYLEHKFWGCFSAHAINNALAAIASAIYIYLFVP